MEAHMFDSLADKMKEDESRETSRTQRLIRLGSALVVAIVVFGGLWMAIRLLE
jgi:magnesium-transporting ATPase (P-type)